MSIEQNQGNPNLKHLSVVYSSGDPKMQKRGEQFLEWAGKDFVPYGQKYLETPVYDPLVDGDRFQFKDESETEVLVYIAPLEVAINN